MGKKYYVGCNGLKREVFAYMGYAGIMPNKATHPQYNAVIGPFRTKRAAILTAKYGYNNPHYGSVADAERIARIEYMRWAHHKNRGIDSPPLYR